MINGETHGHCKHGVLTPTYRSWMYMKSRCKHKPSYSGVEVDSRWDGFELFLEDMGERPSNMTLDRIDGRKGYSPSNCRWASPTTQSRNRVGLRGITWKIREQSFKINIGFKSKVVHLGYRKDWFEAVCLRKSAENKYWGTI